MRIHRTAFLALAFFAAAALAQDKVRFPVPHTQSKGFAGAALAQDKVAYVNMGKVFESFYKAINANIIFEQKKHEFDDKMSVLRTSLEDAARELKKIEEDAKNELLAKSAREEAISKYRVRAEIFGNKREEYEHARQNGIQELRKIQAETEDSLIKELTTFMNKYATDNGYTHVYDVSGLSMNRMPFLLIYPKQQEITTDFTAVVNAGHENELAEAKTKLAKMRGENKAPAVAAPQKQNK